jgi:hypothetical protein
MRTTLGQSGQMRVRPTVEQLESRQLLSVSVLPHNINLKGAQHGNGVFTVRIISDTQAATDLVKAASPTFTVGDVTLTPVRTHTVDLNGDNVPDLILKFRRHDLAGLTAGEQTFKVSAASSDPTVTTPTSEEATFNLFQPGSGNNGHGHGHHSNHGHHHHV